MFAWVCPNRFWFMWTFSIRNFLWQEDSQVNYVYMWRCFLLFILNLLPRRFIWCWSCWKRQWKIIPYFLSPCYTGLYKPLSFSSRSTVLPNEFSVFSYWTSLILCILFVAIPFFHYVISEMDEENCTWYSRCGDILKLFYCGIVLFFIFFLCSFLIIPNFVCFDSCSTLRWYFHRSNYLYSVISDHNGNHLLWVHQCVC